MTTKPISTASKIVISMVYFFFVVYDNNALNPLYIPFMYASDTYPN